MNFSLGQLDTKGILCVKFQNSDINSFRGDAGTTFQLTEIVKSFSFLILRQIRQNTTRGKSHKEHSGENRILICLFVNDQNAINKHLKHDKSSLSD